MIVSSARPSIAVQLTWTVRLMSAALRCRPREIVLIVSAFALATVAALACLAFADFLRAERVPAPGATLDNEGHLVAFLREDLPASARDALAGALGRLPGVASVQLLTSDEALARMRADLGQRASVLDGVEEGFLPATIEISLRTGPDGVGLADAIAWRLRRMEGVTDVDVLRTPADQRWVRARDLGRRAGVFGLAMGSATGLLGLGLAAAAMRNRRIEARFLAGLGFTIGAITAPAALAGALSALLGSLVGILFGTVTVAVVAHWWPGVFAVGWVGGGLWMMTGLLVSGAVIAGSVLGWWGARPSPREWEELASVD